MSSPEWFRWYPAKWLSGVLHLNNEQRGVYIQVINVLLDRGECSADPAYLGRLCNCNRQKAARIIAELVARDKLTESCGKLRQNRAESERKDATNRAQIGSDLNELRWKNKRLSHPTPDIQTTTTYTEERKDAPTVHLTRRASRLPDDWEPDGQQRDYAGRYGLDVDRVAADFRDYWCAVAGQRGLKLDWNRTWQTRCRELADRQARDLHRSKGNGHARLQPADKREDWYGRRLMERHSGCAQDEADPGADSDVAEGGEAERRG